MVNSLLLFSLVIGLWNFIQWDYRMSRINKNFYLTILNTKKEERLYKIKWNNWIRKIYIDES